MLRILDFRSDFKGGKQVDMVLLAPSGEAMERTQTWQRVSSLDPSRVPEEKREGLSYQVMAARWDAIGPRYEAWRTGQEIPEDGTPLAAWPALSPEQVKFMRSVDLRTVEDVANATEGTMQKLPFPDAMKLRDLAKKYLDGRDASEMAAKLNEAEERMKVMEEMIASLQSDKPKPRRGRPPKVEAAEA